MIRGVIKYELTFSMLMRILKNGRRYKTGNQCKIFGSVTNI